MTADNQKWYQGIDELLVLDIDLLDQLQYTSEYNSLPWNLCM